MSSGPDAAAAHAPRLLYLGADADHHRRGEHDIFALTRTRIICRSRDAERKVTEALLASNKRLLDRASDDPMTGKFDYGTALRYDLDGAASAVEMTLVWYAEDFYPVGAQMASSPTHRKIFESAGIAIGDVSSTSYIRD